MSRHVFRLNFLAIYYRFCLFCVGMAFLAPIHSSRAEIKGYTKPKSIADNTLINREPVISETGLIAWHAHSREPLHDEGGGSKIFTFLQGQIQEITKEKLWLQAANIRPSVSGNQVIWQTTRNPDEPISDKVDFVLREVPENLRDVPFPELPGFFAVADQEGSDQAVKGAAGSDSNLNPGKQKYVGPYSNIYEWAAAYHEGPAGSNRTALAKSILATNTNASIKDLNLYSHSYSDVAPGARRKTTEFLEICKWTAEKDVEWITADYRADINPSGNDRLLAWQRAKAFPFGWEIMALKGTEHFQLTTNFYYDLGPKVYEDTVVWYGWDGTDYEIFSWNSLSSVITQVTTNDYDDVSPVIGQGLIAWESYPITEGEIYCLQAGKIRKLSISLDDDLNPVIWNGRVAWQSFDGDDFEIMVFDSTSPETDPASGLQGRVDRITNNEFDDVSPAMRDGLLVWMGYKDNWDAEIFVRDLASGDEKQITDNEYEDKDPQTANKLIIWQADTGKANEILLASPDE